MASPDILDFDRLLQPICAEHPAGEDLREDASPGSTYYAIKDARFHARTQERKADEDPATEQGDWRPVADLAPPIIAERSKDLEITAWLIEALVRMHGFAGLRDGFRLARELVERFWEHLYPLPDEDGLLTRVAPLTGLNGEDAEGTLIIPIRKVWLTEGSSVGPFAYWHYQQACDLKQIADPDKRERRIAAGAITLEQVEQAATETDTGFFDDLREDLEQAQAEFARLCAALEAHCGTDAPPSSNIRNTLSACRETLRFLSRESERQVGGGTGTAEAAAEEAVPAAAGEPVETPTPGGLGNREEAFRTLLKVAEYFRRTEPHSPVSYLLEQAVRWGRMPLPELLNELIADEQARQGFFKLTGIRPESH